jgi:hypothetical protein
MSKKAKLFEKLRNNPKSIRFEEIDLVLSSYGFTHRQSLRLCSWCVSDYSCAA